MQNPSTVILRPLMLLLLMVMGQVGLAQSTPHWRHIAYQETTGKSTLMVNWYIRQQGDFTEILVTRPNKTFYNRCHTVTRNTTHWFMTDGQALTFAYRKKDSLHISQHINGSKTVQQHDLKGGLWFQPMSWSLASLITNDTSSPAKTTFWIVRPDNLKPFKMKATYKKSKDGQAPHQVTVKLTGLLSAFWRANYWFNAKDQLLQRYAGVNGPPGTQKTILKRQSINSSTDVQPSMPAELKAWLTHLP